MAVLVAREVVGVGAEHAEAVMAVAERQRHDPRDLGALGDVLVALPGDVVRGVADAEDRVEQQLDAAAARADDEIGAGDRVGEALARAGAHLLDAEQQHDADGDGEHGQKRRQRAVAQRLQREAEDRSWPRLAPRRNRDLVEPHDAVEARRQPLLVADHDHASRRPPRFGEQQIEERDLTVAVERRGRLVGDDQLRRADQRARGGDALLLADAEVRGRRRRSMTVRSRPEPQAVGARPPRAVPSAGALARSCAKAQRQQDVVEERAVGQQVEHLEDDAEVLGAEAIARRVRSALPCRCRAPRCVRRFGATMPQAG